MKLDLILKTLFSVAYCVFMSVISVFVCSCSNPLSKGEKIHDFDSARFEKVYYNDLVERVEDDRKDHVAQFLLARHYYEKSFFLKGQRHISEAIEEETTNEYLILQAKLYFANKEFEKAKRIIKRLEKLDYIHLDIYKLLAEIYIESKDTDSTSHYISILKKINKNLKEIPFYTALNYQNANDSLDAIREYYNTLGVWPENLSAYENLSALLLKRGDNKNAFAITEKGISQFPGNIVLQTNRAKLIYDQGYTDSAMVFYGALFSSNPKLNNVGFEIGKYFLDKGNSDSALFYFESSIEFKQENIPTAIADIHFSKYRNARALSNYKEALKRDSSSIYIKRQISRCNWRINNRNNTTLLQNNQISSDSTTSNTIQNRDTLQ